MSKITLQHVMSRMAGWEEERENERIEALINSQTLTNILIELPFMNLDFQRELTENDIYTVNQLIGVFAAFNFQYRISRNRFTRMDERLLLTLFYKLEMMGFQIPEVDCESEFLNAIAVNRDKNAPNVGYDEDDEMKRMVAYYCDDDDE